MTSTQHRAPDAVLSAQAEACAAELLARASELETRADRRRRRQVARVMDDPRSRAFLLALTDQVLRIHSPRRAGRRLHDLVSEFSIPSFVTGIDRLTLWAGARLAPVIPHVVVPLAVRRLRREFGGVVLPAESDRYERHARVRRAQGIRLNVNVLGEAILGDDEARRRQAAILEQLRRPNVDYVSVKISAVCAQLDVLAFDYSVDRISERLRPIYAEAMRHTPLKFVNLDMEEYRDLHLTVHAFKRVLSDDVFASIDAGIVLQAYLPDSFAVLDDLCRWAEVRHSQSGAVTKVRIVKGANLAMEAVEAELKGWPQAPYLTKAEVDANFKRLVDRALAAENNGAVKVGVASHNLFDVGWALATREAAAATDLVEMEMLEGMANPQALAVREAAGHLLLYAPIVRRDDFESAVAYLVRRLDENTSPENFLRHLFSLSEGSPDWLAERDKFRAAVHDRHLPAGGPRRTQDRAAEERLTPGLVAAPFTNEPDTDFALAANRRWVSDHLERWVRERPTEIPAVVDGEPVSAPLTGVGIDPSAPADPLYRYVESDLDTVERAVAVASRATTAWRALGGDERRRLLHRVAGVMAARRGETLAAMAHDAAKTIGEGDPEVSEAIDFARYYGDHGAALDEHRFEPHGVVVVASPWNFPFAIPAGGVLAALAAGNAVILKPAPETVLTAYLIAQQCWEADIPHDVLQFVPCADDDVGRRLITHPEVDAVILTGAWDTARLFLGWKPSLRLHAETSGKNAVIITAAADIDDAIHDVVRSAFGHAGQKCSAASLAIVEASLYDEAAFRGRLADTVRSLRVGAAWEPSSQVGALIRPPSGPLARALTLLDAGESWLVQPHQIGDNPRLWRPGVKLGVRPGSEFHLTECFGPVLGLMRADDLAHAIALANQPSYGLTGGIHSLDDREVACWCDEVEVGNAYVNRVITGAIVQRQPFGGWKRSAIGPGAKAGGRHYVASLGTWHAGDPDGAAEQLDRARHVWDQLSIGDDPSGLRAETNRFRLRALRRVVVRIGGEVDPAALRFALAVARVVGVDVAVSTPTGVEGVGDTARIEDDQRFIDRLGTLTADKVRLLGGPAEVGLAVIDAGLTLDTLGIVFDGELEVLRWTREQVISETRHRHGNLRPPPA